MQECQTPGSNCTVPLHIYFNVTPLPRYRRLSHVMRKPVLPYANDKDADQSVHPRSLVSAFVFRCLDSLVVCLVPLVSIFKMSSPYLVSVTAQTGLRLPWSQTPKTDFLMTWLKVDSTRQQTKTR